MNRPKVLLLDEPLGALDLKLRREMQIELKEIQREVGITFVFVTHDQEEALTMSDRIAVFNEGRVEQVATPVELYERPSSAFVAGFVGTSNLLEGEVARELMGADGPFVIRPEKVQLVAPADAPAADAETCVAPVWCARWSTSARPPTPSCSSTPAPRSPCRTRTPTAPSTPPSSGGSSASPLTWRRDHLVSLGGSEPDPVASPEEETA